MHKLNRPAELTELTTARNRYNGTPSAKKAWSDFGDNGDRTKVREQLESTQNNLCAYCENTLANDGHIDHYNPKSSNWRLTFDWDNLVVSCTHNDSCGKKKDDNFEHYWVNPYLVNPTGMFTFYSNGQIEGASTDAQNMIKDFGLDCPRLEGKRQGILHTLQETILSLVDFPDALEAYLESEEAIMFPTGYTQVINRVTGV